MKPGMVFCVFLAAIRGGSTCHCDNANKVSTLTSTPSSSTNPTKSPTCSPNCLQCDGRDCLECSRGWFGEDCSKRCSACPGKCCKKCGDCLSCLDGSFGAKCHDKCPTKCLPGIDGNVKCNVSSGHCDNGCMDGHYDGMCTLQCGHCSNGTCSKTSGQCDGGCEDDYHGSTCKLTCGFCSTGNCSQIAGLCEGGCVAGYYGASCELQCENCSCGTCIQETGQCDLVCPSTSTITVTTSTPIPSSSPTASTPTSMTITTTSTATTTRSPLCPVNCLVCDGDVCATCNSGWFGESCSLSCSLCPGNCSRDSGHCLSCPDGTFGINCTKDCPAKCQADTDGNVRCKAIDGHCSHGCVDGYYGNTCTIPCGHCTIGGCHQTTGLCGNGCNAGYHGNMCKLTCGFCITPACTQSTGGCESGCKAGYYGTACDLMCEDCVCETCSQTTGQCNEECLGNNTGISSFGLKTDSLSVDDQVMDEGDEVEVLDTKTPAETAATSNTSGPDPVPLGQSQSDGPYKSTVNTAVGVTFALLLVGIAILMLVCGKYRKTFRCNILGRGTPDGGRSPEDGEMYVEDDVGSLKLSQNNETQEEYKLVPLTPPEDDIVDEEDK